MFVWLDVVLNKCVELELVDEVGVLEVSVFVLDCEGYFMFVL